MSASQRPRLLFFGTGDRAAGLAGLVQADEGNTDNDSPYAAQAITNAIVAATPSQEVVCFATYVTLRHRLASPLTITVSLYVDERPAIERTVEVPSSQAIQLSRFEIGWSDTVAGGGASVRQAPRGHRARIGLLLPPPAGGTDVFDVDGVECEIELRSESISPSNSE